MKFFTDIIDAKVLPNGRISIAKESLEDLATVMAVQPEINGRQPNLKRETNAYFTALVKLLYEDKPIISAPTLDFIITIMAENHTYITKEDGENVEKNVTVADIKSSSRRREFIAARHRFCYYSKLYAKLSLAAIGRFIDRDHSTIISAVARIEGLIHTDIAFREETHRIETLIRPAIAIDEQTPPPGKCAKGGDHDWIHKHTTWSVCTKCNISEIRR